MLARLRITALNYNGLPTNIKVPTRKTSNRQFKLVADSAAIVNENGMFSALEFILYIVVLFVFITAATDPIFKEKIFANRHRF